MPAPDTRTDELVERLWKLSAGSSLTPGQAKLYSHQLRIGLGQSGLGSFSQRDLLARLEEVEMLLVSTIDEQGHRSRDSRSAALRRAGELLEWLGRSGSITNEVPAFVLSAGAYQVAGYPALARGLFSGSTSANGEINFTRLFLAGEFGTLMNELHSVFGNEDSTSENSTREHLHQAITIETLRCLGVIAAAMRWGDENAMSVAIEKLDGIASVAQHSQVQYSAITARLCQLAAKEYASTSIWSYLKVLDEVNSLEGRVALKRFGRQAFRRGRSLAWPSQVVGIERLRKGGSFVLCTPTGSGKTTIAELALVCDLLGCHFSAPCGHVIFSIMQPGG